MVHLVASLTGPAANLLIGMTMGQLDDYGFLVTRLSRRYDPPECKEAHRAKLRAGMRRRNESADEFAENLKNLAQRAYTHVDPNMLDNLVVERFREGHGNVELRKHLCLYPSTGLQDLIGACVRFETHVELGARAHKSNEGLYTVQSNYAPGWIDNRETEDSTMVDLTDSNKGETLHGEPDPIKMEIVARAHKTQSGHKPHLKRLSAGHVAKRATTLQTVKRMDLNLHLHLKW